MKLDPKAKERMLARLAAGDSTVLQESRRVGLSERHVRRLLDEARRSAPVPPPSSPPSRPGPSGSAGTSDRPPENPKIEEALRDVGSVPGIPPPAAGPVPRPPEQSPKEAASAEDIKLALSTVRGVKGTLIVGLAGLAKIPAQDAVVRQIAGLSPPAEEAVTAAAPWLADKIRQNAGVPYILAAILAVDLLASLQILGVRARELRPPPPKEKPSPAAAPAGGGA